MIRVLIVHPTQLIGSMLVSLLEKREQIYVVGQANSVEQAIFQVEKGRPAIMLVSAALPDQGALKLTHELSENYPEVKVLVIGLPQSKNIILQYVMAGVSGYVLQEVDVNQLYEHIYAAHEEKALVSPEIAAAFMEHIAELSRLSTNTHLDQAVYDELTPREREVLDLIAEDLTNQEIADRLFIEIGTVKNHVHSILQKLDVNSREDAAAHLPYIEHIESEM